MLVLGGPHEVSARVRDEVMAHGGRVAVNLTPLRSVETAGLEVRLDIETNGGCRLAVDLDELSNPGVRVVVGASLAGFATWHGVDVG